MYRDKNVVQSPQLHDVTSNCFVIIERINRELGRSDKTRNSELVTACCKVVDVTIIFYSPILTI